MGYGVGDGRVCQFRHSDVLNDNEEYFNRTFPVCKGKFLINCSLGINNHEHDQRHEENDREGDRETVEVLLDDARAVARVVERAGDGIGDAGALAGMQHDEHDQAGAGHDEQDQEDDEQRSHDSSLSRIVIRVRPVRTKNIL